MDLGRQRRGAAVSFRAAGLVVFLLSVSVIQGQNDWGVNYTSTEICTVKGSTVEIHCSYTHPSRIMGRDTTAKEMFWFTNMNGNQPVDLRKDPQYSGRVQDHCDNNICTLRITDLRESDSAEYKFMFSTNQAIGYTGSPGVILSVTALQVQVTRVTVEQSVTEAELKCHSSCSPAGRLSYVWFKNKEEITGVETLSYKDWLHLNDSVSCAIRGHEQFPSPSVYAPRVPSVSVSPSAEIEDGTSVNLTCSSDANPAANYTWYEKERKPRPVSKEPQHVFSSIRFYHSGQYYCTAENELGTSTSESISIKVKHAPWHISDSRPTGAIVEGSSVTLTCSSDADPAPTLTWYKEEKILHSVLEGNHHFISWQMEEKMLHHGQDGIYRFTSISSEDRGFYYCKSENEYGEMKSPRRFLDVQYAPKLPSVSVSPSAEIVEGISVTLTCSSDANPAANYTWYKENHSIFQGPEGNYYFESISSEDRGIYSCMSKNQYGQNRSSLLVDVEYAPKLPSVSVSPSAEIVEGSSVTLTCSSDANPAAKYTWYKEDEDSPKASGQIFTITNFTAEHSGNYYCEAQNTRGRHNSNLQLIVVADKSAMIITIITLTLVVVLILLLLFCLWIRKKKTLSSTTEPNEPKETPELVQIKSAAETEDTKEEEELL